MAPVVIPPPSVFAPVAGAMLLPLAIWSTIASLELLAARRAFRRGAPLGPDLLRLTAMRTTRAILGSPLASPPVLPTLAAARLAAGLALPVVAWGGMTGVGAGAMAAALLVIAGASGPLAILTAGGDGGDKMALSATVAAALIATGCLIGDRLLCLAGVAWGAGQAAIAYAASGWAKLARSFWRDGDAFAAVMTSYRSGHRFAATIVRRRWVAITLVWAIMLIEAFFPLALIAPMPVCLAWLAALALFHIATAVVMGLNTYPWAFGATYPCVVMANALLVR